MTVQKLNMPMETDTQHTAKRQTGQKTQLEITQTINIDRQMDKTRDNSKNRYKLCALDGHIAINTEQKTGTGRRPQLANNM